MINPALQPEDILESLNRSGRVQVRDFLQEDAAERIHHCLDKEVPWTLAICDEQGKRTIPADQVAALSQEERRQLFDRVAKSASGGEYRFAYDSYMMPRAYMEKRDPHLILHRVLEFLNSPPFLAFMRRVCGDDSLQRMDAQATRYQTGQFLRTHNDEHSGQKRLFAYVLNLTRRWDPDWGGLLHFVGSDGRILDSFMPHWNSLSLFRVPAGHMVSVVAPWAENNRYAITGWGLATATAREANANIQRLKGES